MKCPFCQQELDTGDYFVHCHNPHYDITVEMEGTEEMWEALIDTKKKLDIAIWGLEWIFGYENVPKYVLQHIRKVLDTINQKEEK